MPKIAICDDDPWMREYLSDFVRRSLQIKAALFEDGEALLASSLDFDILFLDICLGPSDDAAAQDGMETAKRLRRRSNALIIFITAMPEYVYDAYDVEAFHYLLKPIDEEKLLRVLNRAVEKTSRAAASPVLSVKANGTCRSIPAKDIYYAENDGRKIILHTRNGVISFYEKMDALRSALGDGFFLSHRGYLVHLQEVASYDRTSITLKCGDTVFLARQKYNHFVEAYMEYLTRQA